MKGLVITTLGQCSENIDHWWNAAFFVLQCISDCSSVFINQSAGLAGEDLAKTLEGLDLDENGERDGQDGNILPIMQSIMQNLLSKEVLYPSLKEITEKVSVCFFLAYVWVFPQIILFHIFYIPCPLPNFLTG